MAKRGFPVTFAMREERRKRAEARQAEYDKLTVAEKLEKLPANGCKKQRAKLELLMQKGQAKLVEAVVVVADAVKKAEKAVKKQ